MHYKIHPYEQGTPGMFVGFDADGNRVAMELVESPDLKSNTDFAVNESEVQVDTDYYNDSHDAARYRWLRANAKEIVFKGKDGVSVYGSIDDKAEDLDKAIDEAIHEVD